MAEIKIKQPEITTPPNTPEEKELEQLENDYSAQTKYYETHKELILKRIKERNDKRKQEKKFYCEKCDKSYTDNRNLQKHLRGNRHKNKGVPKLYNCECCSYSTSHKQNFGTHVKSKKHKERYYAMVVAKQEAEKKKP